MISNVYIIVDGILLHNNILGKELYVLTWF